jgi:hypothetical protein
MNSNSLHVCNINSEGDGAVINTNLSACVRNYVILYLIKAK